MSNRINEIEINGVLYELEDKNAGSSKLVLHTLHLVAETEGQTNFNITLESFDKELDTILVQSGRTMLSPDLDYTVDGKTLILIEGLPVGRTLDLHVFKNIPRTEETLYSGSLLEDNSIGLNKLKSRNITLLASGWSDTYPYEQTVSVEEITPDDSIMIVGVIHASGNTEEQDKAIDKAAGYLMYSEDGVGTNSITFRAKKIPEVDITVVVKGA